MKEMILKWNCLSLIVRIVIGMAIGAALGLAVPQVTVIAILEVYLWGP